VDGTLANSHFVVSLTFPAYSSTVTHFMLPHVYNFSLNRRAFVLSNFLLVFLSVRFPQLAFHCLTLPLMASYCLNLQTVQTQKQKISPKRKEQN
jgi:hypothetical protein